MDHKKATNKDHLKAKDFEELGKKARGSIDAILTGTTIQEKVILLASVLAIVFSFLPWATSKDIQITGVSHFIYLLGFLVIATAIYAMMDVIGGLYGKKFHSFVGSSSKLHILLGLQIIQLGLVSFTIFSGFISLSTLITEVDTNVTLIVFCGVAILGAGLYENAYEDSRKRKKLIHPGHGKDSKQDLKELLKKKK